MRLRNFRAFRELDVMIEPATLIVGANDAGKTTIVEAISAVLATGHDIWEHAPAGGSARGQSSWEQVAFRGTFTEGQDERVFVSLTFDELSEVERESWRAVLDTGAPLCLGRMWEKHGATGTLCVVLDHPHYLQFVKDAGLGAADHPRAQLGEMESYLGEPPTIGDEVWCNVWWLGDMAVTFGTPLLGLVPDPGANVIRIPGPEEASPNVEVVLRPLIRSYVARAASLPGPTDGGDPWDQPEDLGPSLGELDDAAGSAVQALSAGLNKAVAHLRGDSARAEVSRVQRHRSDTLGKVIDQVTGALETSLDGHPIELAGAGARRALLLAGLELYRNPELWNPDEHIILLIEEPEVGLHPSAQRSVARALADLPTYGLQVIAISHSPAVVAAFPPGSIRLARSVPNEPDTRTVLVPEHLSEIAAEIGVHASDVLLARRFVVVEGTSDAKALHIWARTLGLEMWSRGVHVIPARGESRASTLTRFLEVAYEGASFVVVLDGGRQTERTANELHTALGNRVEVRRLGREQIEMYYTPNAVASWLTISGATLDEDRRSEFARILAGGVDKGVLQHLAGRYLDREYHVEQDGGMIARLMREQDVALELRNLLFDLFGESV